MVVLHWISVGVTLSLEQEKSANEQDEQMIIPTIKKSVAFMYRLFTKCRDFKIDFHLIWNRFAFFTDFEIKSVYKESAF